MYSVIFFFFFFKLFILLFFSVTVGLVAGVAYIYWILTNIHLFFNFFFLFVWLRGHYELWGGKKS